jgi:LemA protein
MKAAWMVVVVVLAIIVLAFVGWYISGLNRAVRLHEQTNEKWAQVETMLQRRYDLIPNLVETVRGYAKHEETVFTEVARLRSEWSGAPGAEDENAKAMESARKAMVIVEGTRS